MKKKDAVIEIKKKKVTYYPYCKSCRKSVKPQRKITNDLYFHLWIVASIASLGILLPVFLFYHFHVKKKEYCGYCHNKIKFYDSPDKFPGTKAQLERIVKEIRSEKPDLIHCPFCHEIIDKKSITCPFCKVSLQKG